MTLLGDYGEVILGGAWVTIWIVAGGFALGLVLGILLGLCKLQRSLLLRWPASCYVEIIRNTPFLIQAMVIFALFGVLRVRVAPELLGLACVALYSAAYMAEIFRSAREAIPRSQGDAAASLALGRFAAFRLVILPQLLPIMLPASVNLLATVVKETAFLSALSVAELTFTGQVVIAQTFRVFEVWAIIGLLYLVLNLSLFWAAARLERVFTWSKEQR
ncbi:MAG: hypothetical protein Kilf2KO_12080 [Rhodospirillales bacterium]